MFADYAAWCNAIVAIPHDPINPIVGLATTELDALRLINIFTGSFDSTTTHQHNGTFYVIRACKPLSTGATIRARNMLYGAFAAIDAIR